ncbi:MAG: hypothetical protein ABSG75_11060 [Syntrophales bacterium]|jgi:hypothetical protein
MDRNNDTYLFYDGPYDAIDKAIANSGKTKKAVASVIYPGRQPETAKSLLSRALSPDNTDVRLSVENLEAILNETRPDDYIFYLCDKYGFERPNRKLKKDFRKELETEIRDIGNRLKVLVKKLPELEDDGN